MGVRGRDSHQSRFNLVSEVRGQKGAFASPPPRSRKLKSLQHSYSV